MKGKDIQGILDRKLPTIICILILVVAGSIPTCYVLKHYDSQTQFTGLIFFGSTFQESALTEVRELKPAADSSFGYDGQFYAQIAVKPLLNDPQFQKALDAPAYRAGRIFLPSLAWLLGLGKPFLILQTYAILNLGFWFLLLFGLVHYLRAQTIRDYLCILAVVFTTGSLVSLERALTDLPAATLGFYGAALTGAFGSWAIGLALLTRETSVLFLLRFAWPIPKNRAAFFTLAFHVFLIVAPFLLWIIYARYVFGNLNEVDKGSFFGWPFMGWVEHARVSWNMLIATPVKWHYRHPNYWEIYLFEFLAPVSLIVQVFYFLSWRLFHCAYWRMGAGFAVMFVFLSNGVFVEQYAFCRAVLPMAVAFNIGLMKQRGGTFAFNFIAGNLGLLWGFRVALFSLLN